MCCLFIFVWTISIVPKCFLTQCLVGYLKYFMPKFQSLAMKDSIELFLSPFDFLIFCSFWILVKFFDSFTFDLRLSIGFHCVVNQCSYPLSELLLAHKNLPPLSHTLYDLIFLFNFFSVCCGLGMAHAFWYSFIPIS